MGVTAGDIDDDGDLDLFMTHLRRESNTIYRNDGDAGFMDVTGASGLGTPSMRFTGFGADGGGAPFVGAGPAGVWGSSTTFFKEAAGGFSPATALRRSMRSISMSP